MTNNINMNGYWEVRTRDEQQKIERWEFSALSQAVNFSSELTREDEPTLHWVGENGRDVFIDYLYKH